MASSSSLELPRKSLPNIANVRKQRQRRSSVEPNGSHYHQHQQHQQQQQQEEEKEKELRKRRAPFVPEFFRSSGRPLKPIGKEAVEEAEEEAEDKEDGGLALEEDEEVVSAGKRPSNPLDFAGPGNLLEEGLQPHRPPSAALRPIAPAQKPQSPVTPTAPYDGANATSAVGTATSPLPPSLPTTGRKPLPTDYTTRRIHQLCRGGSCPSTTTTTTTSSEETRPTAPPPFPKTNCTDNLYEYDSFDCSYNSTGNGTDFRNNPGALEVDIESEYDDFLANKSLYIGVIVVAIAVALIVIASTWWGVKRWQRQRGDEIVDDEGRDVVGELGGAAAAVGEKKRWKKWGRSKRWHEKQRCTCHPVPTMRGALFAGSIPEEGEWEGEDQQVGGIAAGSGVRQPEMAQRPISTMLPPPMGRNSLVDVQEHGGALAHSGNHHPHQHHHHHQHRSSQHSLNTNTTLTRSISSSSSAISSPPSYHQHNPHQPHTPGQAPSIQANSITNHNNTSGASRSNSTRTATSSTSNVTDDTVTRTKREYQRTVTRLAEENMWNPPELVADGWRCAPPNPFEEGVVAGGLGSGMGGMGGGGVGVGGMGHVDGMGRAVVRSRAGAVGAVGAPGENPFEDGVGMGMDAGMGMGMGDGFAGYVPGNGGAVGPGRVGMGVGMGMPPPRPHFPHQQLLPLSPIQNPFDDEEYGVLEEHGGDVDVGVGDGFGGYVPGGMMGGGGAGAGVAGSAVAGGSAEQSRERRASVRSGVSSSATLRGDLEEAVEEGARSRDGDGDAGGAGDGLPEKRWEWR